MDHLQDYSGDLKNLSAKIKLLKKQISLWKLYHELLMSISVKNHDGCGNHHPPSDKVTVPLKTFIALACDKLASLSDKQRMMVHLSPQEFRMLSEDHLNELQKEMAKLARKAQPNIDSSTILSQLDEEIEAEMQSLHQQTTALDINQIIDTADNYIQSCHGLPFVYADLNLRPKRKTPRRKKEQLTIQ